MKEYSQEAVNAEKKKLAQEAVATAVKLASEVDASTSGSEFLISIQVTGMIVNISSIYNIELLDNAIASVVPNIVAAGVSNAANAGMITAAIGNAFISLSDTYQQNIEKTFDSKHFTSLFIENFEEELKKKQG
jgi:hypothetical protein